MLKKKAYVNVSKELKQIQKARKNMERELKELDAMKKVLLQVGKGMTKIVDSVVENQDEIEIHKEALIDALERIKRLEEKGNPSDDEMFQ